MAGHYYQDEEPYAYYAPPSSALAAPGAGGEQGAGMGMGMGGPYGGEGAYPLPPPSPERMLPAATK